MRGIFDEKKPGAAVARARVHGSWYKRSILRIEGRCDADGDDGGIDDRHDDAFDQANQTPRKAGAGQFPAFICIGIGGQRSLRLAADSHTDGAADDSGDAVHPTETATADTQDEAGDSAGHHRFGTCLITHTYSFNLG